jgi:uncharacterized protein with HEPN domain
MPSDALTVLEEMDRHVRLAQEFAAGFDLDSFQIETRTVYAVIRCLEILSEASRRLPEVVKARHTAIPWRDIAAAGNVYRHDYEEVAAKIIWDTVQLALPPLQKVLSEEIERYLQSGEQGDRL